MSINISVCVIAKNEEKNLDTCLSSIKHIKCEIILVDTGSTDNTISVAKKYGAKVFEYNWTNDFAAARNYAISKANGKWILFLDADEFITESSLKYINGTIMQAEKNNADAVSVLLINYDTLKQKNTDSFVTIRLFRNIHMLRYHGKIHERLLHADHPLVIFDASKLLNVIHTGYTHSEIVRKDKAQRNLNILLNEILESPDSGDLYFYASESYMLSGDYNKGLEYAFKFLELDNSDLLGACEKNYRNIIQCMTKLGYSNKDIIMQLLNGVKRCNDSADLFIALGEHYFKENMYVDAIESFEIGLKKIDTVSNPIYKSNIILSKVFNILGYMYGYLGNLQKSVQMHIETLKSDKYCYESIKALLLILTKSEKTQSIYNLLKKIYDYDSKRDNIYLFKASVQVNNHELAEKYLLSIDADHKLLQENAQLSIIKGDFDKAFSLYKKLYLVDYYKEYAIMCVISAILQVDTDKLREISLLVKPSIKRIADGYINHSCEVLDVDKGDILDLFKEAIKLDYYNKVAYFSELTSKLNLWNEVAEMAFYYEKYDLSNECYCKCLEDASCSKNDMTNMYYKLAKGLYQSRQYEASLECLVEAWKINNSDYKIYELAIRICKQADCLEYIEPMLQDALQNFPYSNYIKTIGIGDKNEHH